MKRKAFEYYCDCCKKLIAASNAALHDINKPIDETLRTCSSCNDKWLDSQIKVSKAKFERPSENYEHNERCLKSKTKKK